MSTGVDKSRIVLFPVKSTVKWYMKSLIMMTIARLQLTVMVGYRHAIIGGNFIYQVQAACR